MAENRSGGVEWCWVGACGHVEVVFKGSLTVHSVLYTLCIIKHSEHSSLDFWAVSFIDVLNSLYLMLFSCNR